MAQNQILICEGSWGRIEWVLGAIHQQQSVK